MMSFAQAVKKKMKSIFRQKILKKWLSCWYNGREKRQRKLKESVWKQKLKKFVWKLRLSKLKESA